MWGTVKANSSWIQAPQGANEKKRGIISMTDYAKGLLTALDDALKMVETGKAIDTEAGELMTRNRFSRGYALGYAHALSAAFDALPGWERD